MIRTTWLVALAVVLAPGATHAQFGGMGGGGMGGGGGTNGMMMGGGHGFVEIRRAVQVEMEGGRRLNGQIDLGTLMVLGDLGQYAILPDKIKIIRFLKPASEPGADDDGNAQPQQGAIGNNGRGVMAIRRVNQNNGGGMQTVRAKVILNSGEEVVGNIQITTGFRLDLDYGSMIPATDKLRTMTFADIPSKAGAAPKGEARPGATGEDRETSAAPPHYIRYGKALVVRSHAGDRVTLYNTESKQSLELLGPKDPPVELTPIYGQGLMALGLKGPKITRIAVAENASGWHVQDLRQPVEGRLMPIVSQGVAVYGAGRYVYAFGTESHRWDAAELPEGVRATPVVGPNTATVEGRGHLYTFTARTGKWDHIDLKAILDVAGAERK